MRVNANLGSLDSGSETRLAGTAGFSVIKLKVGLASPEQESAQLHRLAGRFLVCAGIVSALSGLWMTHYYSFPDSLQGNLLYFVRIIVGFSMTICILLGLSSVLKKRIAQHQAWMIRAYALGQGAGTQVLIAIPWLVTVGEPSGLTRDILMTTAWVMNIVVAEWIILNEFNRVNISMSFSLKAKST